MQNAEPVCYQIQDRDLESGVRHFLLSSNNAQKIEASRRQNLEPANHVYSSEEIIQFWSVFGTADSSRALGKSCIHTLIMAE